MSYFVLWYRLCEDFVARRAPYRQEHLRLVQEAYSAGDLVLGGALAEPTDLALLVFCAADKHLAENFAQRDPYVTHGLVEWKVRPWLVVPKDN